MRIESIRTLDGPNVYHARPVQLMVLELEGLTDRESKDFEGFNQSLLALLPGLARHTCSRGHPGGFVERLNEGTYFGHVVEHVALELETMIGADVTYGKTRYGGRPGRYHVIVRYGSEHAMRYLLPVAVDLVEAVLAGRDFDLAAHLERAREIVADYDLGPSTRAIVEAAERRGIPWRRLNDANLVQFGHGKHQRRIQAALTDATSYLAVENASDKLLTKQILKAAGIPTPRGGVAADVDAALELLDELGGPVAVKPRYGNQGKGITLGVNHPAELATAVERAKAFSPEVIVEEQLVGDDYRVLVVNGEMVAASHRTPCHVVGDGRSTIAELVAEANRDPRRGTGHAKPLTRIEIDDQVVEHLLSSGMSLTTVPVAGHRVFLRDFANLSTGATAVDVTDVVHPGTRLACERAARAIGLDICGVDLVTSDITEPLDGGILELNAAPGLRMHVTPSEGVPRDVGQPIVDMLYPPGAPSRVPLCAVTGTNGKTTVTRMIGHMLESGGTTVGMTTTDGIYIGGQRIAQGDLTGPISAREVLADHSVEAAVLETARGGILRRGLGYDWSDVAVITNITADHLGQDGIEDLEDLVWIKSLIAERVRDGGTLVLNADDPETVALGELKRVDASRLRVVYYSLDPYNTTLRSHVAAGGLGYTVEGGHVVSLRGGERRHIAPVSQVAAADGGGLRFQLSNSLAAAAAAEAMGGSPTAIAVAMRTFDAAAHNPGRANLFELGLGGVMVDYGHNPAAFAATVDLGALWPGPMIGIVGVPGDRSDALIGEAARAAAGVFDRILIREDADLRGRRPGEVAQIIKRNIEDVSDVPCEVVANSMAALCSLADEISAGALVVIYYEHFDEVVQTLERLGARRVQYSALRRREAVGQAGSAARQAGASD